MKKCKFCYEKLEKKKGKFVSCILLPGKTLNIKKAIKKYYYFTMLITNLK